MSISETAICATSSLLTTPHTLHAIAVSDERTVPLPGVWAVALMAPNVTATTGRLSTMP